MLRRRPTFPTGHRVAELPPITRPLHADEEYEAYSLETGATEAKVLLLKRSRGSSEEVAEGLLDWLNKQDDRTLISHTAEAPKLIGSEFLGVVLNFSGPRLVDVSFGKASQDVLRQLFLDMLDGCEASGDEMPDYDPSLCWVDADGRRPVSLQPLNRRIPDQSEQLALVAEAFYWIAAGRPASAGSMPPSSLENWARNAGSKLSAVVGRCMAPVGHADRIETFDAARLAIFGEGGSDGRQPLGASLNDKPMNLIRGLARVAGMQRLKTLLEREVVAPIRDPEPFKRYGLTVPNGILLYGPPGCGKTFIARQLAEELGHHFVEVIPSELASPYIHQTVMKIREIFDEAEANAPSIIFIDEFEAMVPSRSELGAHQQYKSEEVNEFLAHLNSCAEKKIFVVAATNQPNKIDPAVRRTGRLDKLIYVGPPDEAARLDMLEIHLKGRLTSPMLELRTLAGATNGYSASDLKFLVDEAARFAFANGVEIGEEAFAAAIPKVHPSVSKEVEEEYRTIEERG